MLSRIRSRQKGFTLIELLIVVAIIGIIAAILIPNFLDALHKGRQKRTLGDIKEFGTGLGAYYTDFGGAAAAGAVTVDISNWTQPATEDEIETALVPEYVPQLVRFDGWGKDVEYRVTMDDPPRIFYALVRAQARDGEWQGNTYTAGTFTPTDYDQDIVWADGGFIRNPSGAQQTP